MTRQMIDDRERNLWVRLIARAWTEYFVWPHRVMEWWPEILSAIAALVYCAVVGGLAYWAVRLLWGLLGPWALALPAAVAVVVVVFFWETRLGKDKT